MKNNYLTRRNHRGIINYTGGIVPTHHLFNGKLTFTFAADKQTPEGATSTTQMVITDNTGSGPFTLVVNASIVAPRKNENKEREKHEKKEPKVDAGPSRPDIKEVDNGPEAPPLTIERIPATGRLQLVLNKGSKLLADAKEMRPKEEAVAVEFVFKYGLALTAMGLLDSIKKTPEWETNEGACRERIEQTAAGMGRIIVPLCLSLPKKLPKSA